MKVLLVAIDSKYIHTNLALRYIKSNLDLDSTIFEFTIKDDIQMIETKILDFQADVIGFSVYLWNVEIIKKLTSNLKLKSEATIIFGGPEVSYDPLYFMGNISADFIISGEGETAFNQLVNAIHNHTDFSEIPGLTYRTINTVKTNPVIEISNLDKIKNPYYFIEDIEKLPTRIQYIEMSRGCPFNCSYCLASLDKKVRFFDLERVKSDITYLMNKGAKTFKFLDRTFNYKGENALEIFDFVIKNHLPGTQFQFEITGDLLPENIIDFVNSNAPKGLIRFEIGIQSTNEQTNLAVNRYQNNDRLFNNIKKIQKANIIDLHLDLIAGLPNEDLKRFALTFDEVFSLFPKELQLGFLKMLRGTTIRREALKYQYEYHSLPPYEIIRNRDLSIDDLNIIHHVEDVLEVFWNKNFMQESLKYILAKESSVFDFMLQFSQYLSAVGFDYHRYQRSDLFRILVDFLQKTSRLTDKIDFEIKNEYLLKSKLKPHIWWDNHLEKKDKSHLFNQIIKNYSNIKMDDLYKYAIVVKQVTEYIIYLYYPRETVVVSYPVI